jgi:hypothetical protein
MCQSSTALIGCVFRVRCVVIICSPQESAHHSTQTSPACQLDFQSQRMNDVIICGVSTVLGNSQGRTMGALHCSCRTTGAVYCSLYQNVSNEPASASPARVKALSFRPTYGASNKCAFLYTAATSPLLLITMWQFSICSALLLLLLLPLPSAAACGSAVSCKPPKLSHTPS